LVPKEVARAHDPIGTPNPTVKFQRRACHVTFAACHVPIGSTIHAQQNKSEKRFYLIYFITDKKK